jgi:hypothetical protein
VNRYQVIVVDEDGNESVALRRSSAGDASFDVRLLYAVGVRAFVVDAESPETDDG